jgi:hypothetical protein
MGCSAEMMGEIFIQSKKGITFLLALTSLQKGERVRKLESLSVIFNYSVCHKFVPLGDF